MQMIAEGAEAQRVETAQAERKRKHEEKAQWEGEHSLLLFTICIKFAAHSGRTEACSVFPFARRITRGTSNGLEELPEGNKQEETSKGAGLNIINFDRRVSFGIPSCMFCQLILLKSSIQPLPPAHSSFILVPLSTGTWLKLSVDVAISPGLCVLIRSCVQ